jgi:hypothetical protein
MFLSADMLCPTIRGGGLFRFGITIGSPSSGYLQDMGKRDTAVTFYLLGLFSGMILAFASCTVDGPDRYDEQRTEPTQTSIQR